MARKPKDTPTPPWLGQFNYASLQNLDLRGWAALLASLQLLEADFKINREQAYERWLAKRSSRVPFDVALRNVTDFLIESRHEAITDSPDSLGLSDGEVLLKINLNCPPDVLKSEFSQWIAEKKRVEIPRRSGRATEEQILEGHLQDWYHHQIVLYWDIKFWAAYKNIEPTKEEIGGWMVPLSSNPGRNANIAQEALDNAFRLIQSLAVQADVKD